jgi:hypothetical protein
MKNCSWVSIGLLAFALITKPALAVPFTFSEAGWPGGGEITGSFDIDFNHSTLSPGTLYADALTSFSAHWSGSIYSQPFDWDLASVSPSTFAFSIGSDQLIDMTLDGDVYYDSTLPLVWDFRPTAINILPEPRPSAQYYGTGPFILTPADRVPDANNTFLLLGMVVLFFFGFTRGRRLRHLGGASWRR